MDLQLQLPRYLRMTRLLAAFIKTTHMDMAHILFSRRSTFKRSLFALLCCLLTIPVWAQTTIVTLGGETSVTCPAVATATWTTPPAGVSFSNLTRGSGITCYAIAPAGIAGSGFTSTSYATAYSASQYFTVTITAGSSGFLLSSITWLNNGTGTARYSIAYQNNGGPITAFGTTEQTNTSNTFNGSVLVSGGTSIIIYALGAYASSTSALSFKNGSTFTLTPFANANFYSAATGSLDNVNTWGTNTNGTGAHPGSMTGTTDTFHIANGNPGVLDSSLTLASSSIFVFDNAGTTAQTAYALSGSPLEGTINVAAGCTLAVADTLTFDAAPTGAGTISASAGTIGLNGTFTVPTGKFTGNIQNLILKAGTVTWSPVNTTVTGNITLTAGALNIGTDTFTVAGNITRTSGTISASTGAFVFNGTTAQTIANGSFLPRTMASLTLNNSAGLTSNHLTTINNLTLISGVFASDTAIAVSTITRSGGSINASTAVVSNPNLAVTIIGSNTSGPELAADTVGTLTIASGTYTLSTNLTTGAGGLIVNSGDTLDISTNTLTINGPVTVAGYVSAGSGNITVVSTSAVTLANFSSGVQNLTINGAGGTTLTGSAYIAGTLTLTSGILSLSSVSDLGINSTIVRSAGSVDASRGRVLLSGLVTVPDGTFGNNDISYLMVAGRITWNPVTANINSFQIFGASTSFILATGDTLNLNGSITRVQGGTITASGATIGFQGSANQTVPIAFISIAKNIIINNPLGVTIRTPITVTNALVLKAGTLSFMGRLTMADGSTLIRTAGSLTASFLLYGTGAGVNIVYNGLAATAGNELTPSSGTIDSLIISSGTYTLASSPVLTALSVASGATLDAGTNNITLSATGANIAGTFQQANTNGFSGGANTAIASTNNPAITLATGSTIVYNGSGTQPVDARTDYKNLTINNTGGTIAGNTVVAGTLTLSGKLMVGNNTLSIGNFSGSATNSLSVTPASTITTTGALTNPLYFDAAHDTIGALNIGGNATLGNALYLPAGSTPGTVTVTSGTLATGGNITLLSDANGTARIGQITGTGVTGNVNIQRYVPGQRGYRLLGHPYTTAQDLTNLAGTFDITGAGQSTLCTGTNPSVFSYTPGAIPTYTGITSGTGTFPAARNTTATQSNGILAFIRGAKGEDCLTSGTTPPSNVTFTTVGAVNTGTITQTVPAGGWNLIANPYPSQVNLASVSGIDSLNGLKVVNPGGQADHTYTNGTAYVDLDPAGILPINGAFLAHNGTASDVVITFTEASKTGGTPVTGTFKTTSIYPTLGLGIYNGSNLWDNWSLQLKPQTGNGANDNGDLEKISNAQLDIYSLSTDNAHMNHDARDADSIADGSIIPLGLRSVPQTAYTLRVSENSLPANKTVYLHDKYTGTYTQLNNGQSYAFAVDANAASQGEGRMELLFNNVANTSVSNVAGTQKIQVAPNPAVDNISLSYPAVFAGAKEISIVNAVGQLVSTVKSADKIVTVDISNLASGLYMVKTIANGNTATGRFIKN